jgi:tetratricopeptide (TPR) repeat protein
MNFKINVLGATALAVACSMLPIQAQAFLEDSDARKEILKQREDLKKINPRIDSEIKAINARIDSEIKNINTRIDNQIEQLARRIDTKADDKKVNALFTDLEKLRSDLRSEVAELRGQVEILNNELRKSQQKVDKLTNDLANESRKTKDLHKNVEDRLSRLEPRRQTIDGVDYELTQKEKKAIDEATALLKKRDFANAAKAFATFLQRFPGSDYAPQAYYLLGSSYVAADDCKNAIPALQTVVSQDKKIQKTPDVMLNLAICHQDLDNSDAARSTLEALIKEYPSSPAAETARGKLNALK